MINDKNDNRSKRKKDAPQLSANVVFVENHLPGLESGDYTMAVKQEISGSGKGGDVKDEFSTTKQFSVLGERFVLGADKIYSSFPANDHQGDFSNCLPHLVFSGATFPWQRGLGEKCDKNFPWIGLLVFAQEEAPDLKQITLGSFRGSGLPDEVTSDQMLFYDFKKETGDHDDDPCKVIDVPVDLFNQLAPSVNELKYLAHVRKVEVDNKATSSQHYPLHAMQNSVSNKSELEVNFSVLVGNRLLSKVGRYNVHLVSFENMGDYLPDSEGGSNIDEGKKYIRLVSLYNWHFNIVPENNCLSDIISKLDKSPINLKLPNLPGEKSNDLNRAFNMGYVPVEHSLRVGGETVSWYRGPCVPYQINSTYPYSKQSADSWLKYDPDWSMFDVSYAAAWEIGRLLALQNKKFAETLYQYKSKSTLSTICHLEQQMLSDHLTSITNLDSQTKEDVKQTAFTAIKTVLNSYLQFNNKKDDDHE